MTKNESKECFKNADKAYNDIPEMCLMHRLPSIPLHMSWFAVYTKPRWEKKVTDGLLSHGFEAYCPLNRTLRQWSDRKKWVELPLLPSYVFVRVSPEEEAKVRMVAGVINYVYWLGKKAVIREEEIAALKDFVSSHQNIQIERLDYQPGDVISLDSGPFTGKEATVTAVKGKRIELVLQELGMRLVVNRES